MRHSRFCGCATASTDCGGRSKQPVILTIDDDPNVSQAIKRGLNRYRVTLLQAHHGTHGIWLATTQKPDVIITDLRMPQGRGQDVVAYLSAHPRTRQVPIIVLTGVIDDELRSRMLDLGAAEYLIKPVAFEDLCRAMGRFVELEKKEAMCC